MLSTEGYTIAVRIAHPDELDSKTAILRAPQSGEHSAFPVLPCIRRLTNRGCCDAPRAVSNRARMHKSGVAKPTCGLTSCSSVPVALECMSKVKYTESAFGVVWDTKPFGME